VYLGVPMLAVILLCGGVSAVGALTGSSRPSSPDSSADVAGRAGSSTTAAASPSATTAQQPATVASSDPPQPNVVTTTATESEVIPFDTKTVEDPTLASGTRRVRTKGVTGIKTRTYQVTLTNGVQTGKQLLHEEVTKEPVTEVVAVGTKATASCDPNYSGACVPIASDVDCAGGSGDGPAYVTGPVRVIGRDIYHLDSDGDGIGCE
jgi:resuscitation-promoting factor RpfB